MIHLDRVLVPIDFSVYSEQALKYGQELCEKFGAQLHLLHVLDVLVGPPQFAMGLAIPQRAEEPTELAMEELNKLPGDQWSAEREVVRATAHGAPFVEIVRYAKEHEIGLIVMGTHGRTGLSHVFMGSVAENVCRQTPCPVMIVPKEDRQFVAP